MAEGQMGPGMPCLAQGKGLIEGGPSFFIKGEGLIEGGPLGPFFLAFLCNTLKKEGRAFRNI